MGSGSLTRSASSTAHPSVRSGSKVDAITVPVTTHSRDAQDERSKVFSLAPTTASGYGCRSSWCRQERGV